MRYLAVLLALAPIVSVAQPLIPQKMSLEAQALNSRYIVVGTIVRLQKPASGDLTVGAVIKIEQSLKGVGVGDEMEFHLYDKLEDVEKWRDGKARLMVFHDRPTIVLSDPALEVWTSAAVLGGEFSTMLHTGGFSGGQGGSDGVLRRAENVIELVKRTVAAYPGVFGVETFNLAVPGREDHMRVAVPANAALERWAQRTLPISADQHRRAEAAKALGYFRSDANIATLRKLLTDEGTVPSERDGKKVHLYLVRIRAWYSLQSLGIDVPKPAEYKDGDGLLLPLS